MWLGVDTGGTFTDFVLFDGNALHIHKVLSTPHAPEQAILQGIRDLGLDQSSFYLIHGSTVATNAVLEGKGVKTVYITNTGFADALSIGRQARRELYNLQPKQTASLVPISHCLEINTRLSAKGELINDINDDELQLLVNKVQQLNPRSVAINLLFSFLNNQQEKKIADALPHTLFTSCSSDVLPQYKEYERGVTTYLNASVGPLMKGYLKRLQQNLTNSSLAVMQSSGGTVSATHAGQHAVSLLLSGPAGGLKAAQFIGQISRHSKLLTFDMGGTSTDVALINGNIQLTDEGHIGEWPIAVPMVDMHTIGAGGGSIAYVDAGGLLQVGPESAGANPGPACYGQHGHHATVTDANLILGRLLPDAFLGGTMRLDIHAAKKSIEKISQQLHLSLEQTASGIIQIANEHMAQALRVMSVQRGIDPRDYILLSFGGAGGLHVCALADALGIHQALVPIHNGVFSALGMLVAAPRRDVSRSVCNTLMSCDISLLESTFDSLEHTAYTDMKDELSDIEHQTMRSVDLRYQGQSFTLNLPWNRDLNILVSNFHKIHEARYGHKLNTPVELVNIRVQLEGKAPAFKLNTWQHCANATFHETTAWGENELVKVYPRQGLQYGLKISGPALITETVATTWLAKNWDAHLDSWGNLVLIKS